MESGATLLRSPKASEASGGALGEAEALKRGNTVGVRDQVMDLVAGQGLKVSREIVNMPTPTTMDAKATNSPTIAQKFLDEGRQTCLTYEVILQQDDAAAFLPTPKALDGVKGNLKTSQERRDAGFFVDLPNVANDLAQQLPTPTASDWKGANHSGSGSASSRSISTVVEQANWGKFEPAIRRWEAVMGRPAPAPTLPDGKDGNHRLSPWLTEWMMGLPEGWICSPEIGLTRNEQLKAAGNGVCPQQAMLALDLLGITQWITVDN